MHRGWWQWHAQILSPSTRGWTAWEGLQALMQCWSGISGTPSIPSWCWSPHMRCSVSKAILYSLRLSQGASTMARSSCGTLPVRRCLSCTPLCTSCLYRCCPSWLLCDCTHSFAILAFVAFSHCDETPTLAALRGHIHTTVDASKLLAQTYVIPSDDKTAIYNKQIACCMQHCHCIMRTFEYVCQHVVLLQYMVVVQHM